MNRSKVNSMFLAALAIGGSLLGGGYPRSNRSAVRQAGLGCQPAGIDQLLDTGDSDDAALGEKDALASPEDKRAARGHCAAGLTKCKGSCVNTQSDFYNCGACGVQCPIGAECQGG